MKNKMVKILRWSEKYINTDMVYAVHGAFWLLLWKGIGMITSIVLLAVFAKWTPKEVYGGYNYILSMIGIIALLAFPGIDIALIRAVAQGREKTFFTAAKGKLFWASFTSLVFLAVSGWYFLHSDTKLGLSFLLVAILFPLLDVFPLYLPYWNGKNNFYLQSKYSIISRLCTAAALIPVIIYSKNLVVIIFVYLLSNVVIDGILFWSVCRKVKDTPVDDNVISNGKHFTFNKAIPLLASHIDKVIIWQVLGPTSLAIYAFAQLPVQRLYDLMPIYHLALPKLSTQKPELAKRSLGKKVRQLFFLTVLFYGLLFVLAPHLYYFLFPGYQDAVPFFQVLALTFILTPFLLFEVALVAAAAKKLLYIVRSIYIISLCVLLVVLTPLYGLWGAVFAILISKIIDSALLFLASRRI